MGAVLLAGSGPCGISLGLGSGAETDGKRLLRHVRQRGLNLCSEADWECGATLQDCCADVSFHETIRCDVPERFEALMQELFRVHDLNENGLLEEGELIQLNKKIAMLHYGRDIDLMAITAKYRELYRSCLDAEGQPVPYSVFREYMLRTLSKIDPDLAAQEMVMEQFINEAVLARSAFHCPSTASVSDVPFLSKISREEDLVHAVRWDRGLPASDDVCSSGVGASSPWAGKDGKAGQGDVYVFRIPSGFGLDRMLSTTSAGISLASPGPCTNAESEVNLGLSPEPPG